MATAAPSATSPAPFPNSVDVPRLGPGALLGSSTLADGTHLQFRLGKPGDRDALVEAFERLSDRSRYLRFFSTLRVLPPTLLDRLCDVSDRNKVAVVVSVDRPDDPPGLGELIGVVRYVRSSADPAAADVALTITDDWQGRGIAGAAWEHAVALARREGIERFTAIVLRENQPMMSFFRRRGATFSRDADDWSTRVADIPIT